jgi:hypothetical protein
MVVSKEHWGDGRICLFASIVLSIFIFLIRYSPIVLADPHADKIAVALAGYFVGLPLLIIGAVSFVVTLLRTVKDGMTSYRVLGMCSFLAAFAWLLIP